MQLRNILILGPQFKNSLDMKNWCWLNEFLRELRVNFFLKPVTISSAYLPQMETYALLKDAILNDAILNSSFVVKNLPKSQV